MSDVSDQPAVIDGQLDIYDQLDDEADDIPLSSLNTEARE